MQKISAAGAAARAVLLVTSILVAGCAARQRISLDCVPSDVTIYVDKKALDGVPEELQLSTDEPHTLFFKREGFEPTMVVLEPEDTEAGPALAPADPCVELHFVERTREIQIEVEGEN